ncbi:MAG: ABC transporter permease, partial [Defluviitaleaceae bacterium]|nr:ABC transporter permease [Defluviitaleaceae bacterium]
SGVFVMSSGISIFTIGAVDWIYIFTNASYESTRIPVDHMPRVLRNLFTFFMPMLVISYFPASAIGGWSGAYWRGWLALPAGVIFFCAAMLVWGIGVRHYKSTGS